MALRDLRAFGFACRVPVSLDASGINALQILQQRLMHGKPRVIKAGWQEKPVLIFADGALEDDNQNRGPAAVGAVMFLPDMESAHVFGCEVPSGILDHWRSDGKHHVIGLVELYGAVLALRHWRKYLDDRRVILFLDSWPVLDTLVKGDANVAMWREVLMVLENPLLTVGGPGPSFGRSSEPCIAQGVGAVALASRDSAVPSFKAVAEVDRANMLKQTGDFYDRMCTVKPSTSKSAMARGLLGRGGPTDVSTPVCQCE